MNDSFVRLKTGLITLLLVGSIFIPRIPHLLGDTLFIAGCVCIFAVWLTQMMLVKKIATKLTPFNNVLFVAGVILLISLLISPHFLEGFYAYLKLACLILIAFVILNHEEPKKLANYLSYALIITSAVLALAALAEYLLGLWGTPAGGRVQVSFPNPNHFAGYLAAGMMLLAFFLLDNENQGRNRVLLSIILIIELMALIATKSKGGFLSAWFGIALLLFWKQRRWAYRYVSFSALFLLIVLVSPLKNTIFHRELSDPFTFEKVALFKETFAYIKDHLFLGTGFETFKYYYPQYKSMPELRSAPYVHNEFLNVWTDMGLLGFGAFLGFLWIYFSSSYRLLKENTFGFLKGFVAVSAGLLLHSMVEFNFHTPALALLFTACASLVGNFSKEQKGQRLEITTLSPQAGVTTVWIGVACLSVILTCPILAQKYADRGEEAYRNLNYVEAINDYSKAVKLNPLNAEILEQTARVYFKIGTNLQDEIFLWASEHYMEKAVRLESLNPFRYRSLVGLYEKRGKLDKAVSVYPAILEMAPNVKSFRLEYDALVVRAKKKIKMPTLAHELGHTYGFGGALSGSDALEEYTTDPALPPDKPFGGKGINNTTIYESKDNRARYLSNGFRKYCFMGNSTPSRSWIENSHFNTLITTLQREVDPETIHITGTIFKADNRVEIDSLFPLKHDTVSVPSEFATEEYNIESVSSTGEILFRLPIGISPEGYTYDLPIPESENPFSVSVPYHPDTARFLIKHNNTVIKEIVRSPRPPFVKIKVLNIENGQLILSWDSDDPDGDHLIFDIYCSKDNGSSWDIVTIDCENTMYRVPLDQLPGGPLIFQISATDGFNTAEDISRPIQIEDKPPVIGELSSPYTGSEFLAGEQIRFSAFISDLEDDDIAEKATWSSSIDGEFGKGIPFEYSTLSLGDHTITLSVIDSEGKIATSSVHIKITEKQNPDVSVKEITVQTPFLFQYPVVGEETEITAKIFNIRTEAFCDVAFYIDGILMQKLGNILCEANQYTDIPLKWTPTENRPYKIRVELSNFNPYDEYADNNCLEKTIKVIKRQIPFKSFNVKEMTIHWAQGKHDQNKFQLAGKIDLPDDYTTDMLKKQGAVTLSIEKNAGGAFTQTSTLDFSEKGPIWRHKAPKSQQTTAKETLLIEKMLIFWLPESVQNKPGKDGKGHHKRTGWFMIQGNINIPDTDQATLLPKATLTLDIPLQNTTAAGSLQSSETVTFKTQKDHWLYNTTPHERWRHYKDSWWEDKDIKMLKKTNF